MPDNERDIEVQVNDDGLTDNEDPMDSPMEKFFYHQRRALEETGKALESLLPPDFRKHGTEASKEFSKGVRVLVDAAIDELKKISERDDSDEDEPETVEETIDDNDDDDEPPSSTTGKSKVKIKLD